MSTRCQVILKKDGKPVHNFYKHCDGYPSEMLPWIDNNIDAMVKFDTSGFTLDFLNTAFMGEYFFCDGVRYYGMNELLQSDLDYVYVVDITTKDYSLTIYDGDLKIMAIDWRDGGEHAHLVVVGNRYSIANPILC